MENKKTNPVDYKIPQEKILKKVAPVFHTPSVEEISNQLKSGDNSYLKFTRIENAAYDPSWIKEIEDCLFDLGQIVKNPRSVTETVGDVVPVELARKTNGDSVQHLATHSQFVKEIDDDGNVIPNKILNIGADDFYKTYENRFIATLIRKLVLFVEKRCVFIDENTNVRESQVLLYKNKSMVDGKEVEIETKIKVIGEADISTEEMEKNHAFAARVEKLRRYILYYYNSDFMKVMKTERNVKNPILMTNIIRKNLLYNHCYRLYKFIERYELLGVEFKTNDKYEDISKDDLENINNAMTINFLALNPIEGDKNKRVETKTFKPKILSNIDDDQFCYGPWVKGPFEFARIDQSYISHLSRSKKNLPAGLTRQEKNFYRESILSNKDKDMEEKNLKRILARKHKEAEIEQKYFDKVISDRELEDARRMMEEEQRRDANLLSDIEAARRMLMGDLPEESSKSVEPPKVEEPKPKETKKPTKPKKKKPLPAPIIVHEEPHKPIVLKEEPKVEEPKPEPIVEPIEPAPVVEEPKVEEPKVEEIKPVEKKPKAETKPAVKKTSKPKPKKEPAPKVEKPKEEKKIEPPQPKVEEKQREKIPGQFIVKLLEGYYVDEKTLSDNKSDAKIFDDFNVANDIKKARGGKVVKL